MPTSFTGRPLLAGACRGEAIVSHFGFNTLASFQKSIVLHAKTAVCGDQNNLDLYQRVLTGKILCLPQTIGSTAGGLAIQTAAEMGLMPRAMLFSEHIDSLAASGVILTDVWSGKRIIVVDQLGPAFLQSVKTGQIVEICEDGTIIVS